MKTIRIVFSCILLLCYGVNGIYAQQWQQTVYEKKVLEITQKYCKQLTILVDGRWTQQDEVMYNIGGIDLLEIGIATQLFKLEIINPNEAKRINNNMETELKQSERLKTSIDLQREKDAAFKATDFGKIHEAIKNTFGKWNSKGEFEKVSDYEERLKTQSLIEYKRICTEEIQKRIGRDATEKLKKELSTYNSENESYNITFKLNNVEWSNKLMVPISQAQQVKENWSKFTSTINIYDWCFADNNLNPIQVVLTWSNHKYELPVQVRNQRDIIYSFDNLGIANTYLKGFKYNYSEERKFEQERVAEQERLQAQRERDRIAEQERLQAQWEQDRVAQKEKARLQKEKDDTRKNELQFSMEKNAKNNMVVSVKGKKLIEHEKVELVTEDLHDRYWFFVIGWGGYYGIKVYDTEKDTVKSVLYRTYSSYRKLSKYRWEFSKSNDRSEYFLDGKTGTITKQV